MTLPSILSLVDVMNRCHFGNVPNEGDTVFFLAAEKSYCCEKIRVFSISHGHVDPSLALVTNHLEMLSR